MEYHRHKQLHTSQVPAQAAKAYRRGSSNAAGRYHGQPIDRTTDLFEGLWPITQEGVSYNTYLINDEKKAIVDLTKALKGRWRMENEEWRMEDVDGDSDLDLLLHFKTQELNLTEDSTDATLTVPPMAGSPSRARTR